MKHSKILSVFVIAFVFILSSITPVIAKADCNIFCHIGGAVHTVVTVVVNPVINAVAGVGEAIGGVVTTAAGAVGNAVGINNSLGQVGGSMIQDGENRLTNAVTGVGDISGSHPVSCGVESSPVTLGSPVTWHGEGEAAGEMFSFIGSDGSKVITYSAATQNNNGEIKYSYTYNTPGTYSMTINASNIALGRLSDGICNATVVVVPKNSTADQPPVGEFNPISGSLSLNQITTQMANSKTSNFLSFFNNIIAEVKNIGTKNVFASTLRTITATAGADGSINPSGTIYLPQLATQEFTIQANSGYRVSNVTVDGVSQGAIVEYMLPSDFSNHTISATFVLQGAGSTSGGTGTTGGSTGGTTGGGSVGTGGNTNTNTVTGTYTITLSAGSGGLISPSGSQSVDPGTTMPVRIVPDSGNVVSSVLVDGNYVATTSSYSFSRIYADHSISVTFAPAPVVPKIYTITASAGAGGTIVSAGTWNLPAGSYQTFTITPNSDYTADVMVDGSDKGAISTYTFSNVTANHTISATFVAIPVNNPTQPTQPTQTTQSVTPALVSAPVSSSCRVEGWVCDPDDYSAQLPVTISSGATTLGTITANQADWSTDVSCGGFPNHSYVFNIPSGSVFEDGKSHSITATVQSVDYSGVSNSLNNKVWNSTLICSPTGNASMSVSTSTGKTVVEWSTPAPTDSCSVTENGGAAISLPGLNGDIIPTQDELDNGVKYILTCVNGGIATLNLYPGLRCTPSQSGNATGDTNIYVNKQMTWNLSATDNNKSKVSGASWTGGLNSYSTIYTTIGQKSFSVSATVGGKPASTECMTTVKLGVSTSSEI
jgi:hypothetical protein